VVLGATLRRWWLSDVILLGKDIGGSASGNSGLNDPGRELSIKKTEVAMGLIFNLL